MGTSAVHAGERAGTPLRAWARDVHSQNGEDGIIEEVLRRLGELTRPPSRPLWCVEFGAWDGVRLSNTRHLIESFGAHAVLIEPGSRRYSELVRNTAAFRGVVPVCSRVDSFGPRRLDRLLSSTACPREFDVLSIDVDGHDYWVWEATRAYRPTVVVIEFNPTIPYRSPYRTPRDPSKRHGSSLSSIASLGVEKGYALAAVTAWNAVLVREDRAAELGLGDATIESLTEGLTDFRTFLFVTPDGRVKLEGNRVMMWHGVMFDERRVQALPWPLRTHHDAMGPLRSLLLRAIARSSRRAFDRALARRRRAREAFAARSARLWPEDR